MSVLDGIPATGVLVVNALARHGSNPAPDEVAQAARAAFESRGTQAPAPVDDVDARPARVFTITVYGTPGPQGSKSFKGTRTSKRTGRATPILVESSKKVTPWRDAVEEAAAQAMNAAGRSLFPLTGPLEAEMAFSLESPARIPKERIMASGIALPMCYPDLSKLLRSTEDALTTAGVWFDDAQVVNYRSAGKLYAAGEGALPQPGVVIRIWQIGGAS